MLPQGTEHPILLQPDDRAWPVQDRAPSMQIGAGSGDNRANLRSVKRCKHWHGQSGRPESESRKTTVRRTRHRVFVPDDGLPSETISRGRNGDSASATGEPQLCQITQCGEITIFQRQGKDRSIETLTILPIRLHNRHRGRVECRVVDRAVPMVMSR